MKRSSSKNQQKHSKSSSPNSQIKADESKLASAPIWCCSCPVWWLHHSLSPPEGGAASELRLKCRRRQQRPQWPARGSEKPVYGRAQNDGSSLDTLAMTPNSNHRHVEHDLTSYTTQVKKKEEMTSNVTNIKKEINCDENTYNLPLDGASRSRPGKRYKIAFFVFIPIQRSHI